MPEMLSMEFNYKGKSYFALVRYRLKKDIPEYHITVMNGDLEALIFGHHKFRMIENNIEPLVNCENEEVSELQDCISQGLLRHLSQYEWRSDLQPS